MKKSNDLGAILKSSISAEELTVQKKTLSLEEKLSMVDQLNGIQTNVKLNTAEKNHTVTKTFTLKKEDLDLINVIVDKYLNLKEKVNKSEILRIGIFVLNSMSDDQLIDALSKIDRLTPGRKY